MPVSERRLAEVGAADKGGAGAVFAVEDVGLAAVSRAGLALFNLQGGGQELRNLIERGRKGPIEIAPDCYATYEVEAFVEDVHGADDLELAGREVFEGRGAWGRGWAGVDGVGKGTARCARGCGGSRLRRARRSSRSGRGPGLTAPSARIGANGHRPPQLQTCLRSAIR